MKVHDVLLPEVADWDVIVACAKVCSKVTKLMLTDAIKHAETEHVVYFLLTAYVETLGYADSYGVPEQVKRLAIRSKRDVRQRLGVMRDILEIPLHAHPHTRQVIEEAADVFDAASDRLLNLQRGARPELVLDRHANSMR